MTDLSAYGYTPSILPEDTSRYIPARVTAVHKERFEIVCQHGICYGRLKTSIFFSDGLVLEEFPTTGDFVLIQYNPQGDSLIIKTLPRKTFFSRHDPTPGRGEQAVAANFDYVFIMASLNHEFNLKRIERYLTLAWQSQAQPVVLLTKADLVDDPSPQVQAVKGILMGDVPVIPASTVTGFGLESLHPFLQPGKTIVFLGSSGVGKSSLLNAVAGNEIMLTSEIRQDDSRGRHTTTYRQLIRLSGGAMIIDTPGMRQLGMWDVSLGLEQTFADVDELLGMCKFSDCTHNSEPGCAIKDAIQKGLLSPKRWESYLQLKKEARFSDDRALLLREKYDRNKAISQQKKLKKQRGKRH